MNWAAKLIDRMSDGMVKLLDKIERSRATPPPVPKGPIKGLEWPHDSQIYLDIAAKNRHKAALDTPERDWFVREIADSYALYAISCYIHGETDALPEAVRCMSDACKEYFFGEWRTEFEIRPGYEWMNNILYRWLPWLCSTGQWDLLHRCAHELPALVGHPEKLIVQEAAYYRALLSFFCDDDKGVTVSYLRRIGTGKKKPILAGAVLEALVNDDAAAYQDAMLEYLRYYKKHEFRKNKLDRFLALDASTLYYAGLRKGIVCEIPEDMFCHIVKL